MYHLYILQCESGALYTGIATDVKRRFEEHKNGKGGRYTRAAGAKKILYTEEFKDRSGALKREAEVKRWTRTEKLKLIKQGGGSMATRKVDIHKAAGILIHDRKFLVTRSRGKLFFVSPGGKLESNESAQQALVRELKEELSINVRPANLKKFGSFFALAEGDGSKYLEMNVFMVKKWAGKPQASGEVEEIKWIGSKLPARMQLGSIFLHDVLPKLKKKGLID